MGKEATDPIFVIDSHTAGEPTRVVVSGLPEPAGRTMVEKREHFRKECDSFRRAIVCEPRGHEAMVGALLCEPTSSDCVAGVIFFNNVDVLHGCLHGTMGVAVTLFHLGRISEGIHRIDTPTGVVSVSLGGGGRVTVGNIRSYRSQSNLSVSVPRYSSVSGDVAWGGNWFFLTEPPSGLEVKLSNLEALTVFCRALRLQLAREGITGESGARIDHIELFGPPGNGVPADSRNFVLCPGDAYDRSPCGTGTSAKLACLHAEGKLAPGEIWRQSGILDSVFEGIVEVAPEGGVFPVVTGSAFITAESSLIISQGDPFAFGISYPSSTD